MDLSKTEIFDRMQELVQSATASKKEITALQTTNQSLKKEVKDLHGKVTRLENFLGNEKCENTKALATFSTELSELHEKANKLQVSADDGTPHIRSLVVKVDRTTQWFDVQAQINTNIATSTTVSIE